MSAAAAFCSCRVWLRRRGQFLHHRFPTLLFWPGPSPDTPTVSALCSRQHESRGWGGVHLCVGRCLRLSVCGECPCVCLPVC